MKSNDLDITSIKYIRVDPKYMYGVRKYTVHEVGLKTFRDVRSEFFDTDVQRRVVMAQRGGSSVSIALRLFKSWRTIVEMRHDL